MRKVKLNLKGSKSFARRLGKQFKSDKRLQIALFIALGALVLIFILALLGPKTYLFNPIDVPVSSPTISQIQDKVEENSEVKILMAGDVMMARTIGASILNGGNPFEHVKSTFDKYDFVAVNLETNISTPGIGYPASGKLYTFNSPLKSIDVLKENGIKLVSLANNHVADYGKDALVDQLKQLDAKSIAHVGAGLNIDEAFEPKYILVKNLKVAFVAFNDIENWFTNATSNTPGNANFDDSRMIASLKKARKNADIVVVWPHWGVEYSLSNSERQQQYAHLFIDYGADIVVGAHPHVVQNIEQYKGKTIYYSMGNFVFDGMSGIANATDGAMIEIIIKDKTIESSKFIKIKIDENGFPKLAE